MIQVAYGLKRGQRSIQTLSPKGLKKPQYFRLKCKKQKQSKSGRSLYSIQTNCQYSNESNLRQRILSHRKLISVSSLENKINLTDRNNNNDKNVLSRKTLKQYDNLKKKKLHLNKFYQQNRNQKLYTIQNEPDQNLSRALEIKQNILKQFIGRFQQQLQQIHHQKSSRKGLISHRIKEGIKQQTKKKQRVPLENCQENNNNQTINPKNLMNKIQNDCGQSTQKNKFQNYLKQILQNKKKNQKIIIKNHCKSIQNMSISKIGQTQRLSNNQKFTKIVTKNNLNLKQLFKHNKKYDIDLKSREATVPVQQQQNKNKVQQQQNENINKQNIFKICQNIGSLSPIKAKLKQVQQVYMDCSSIEKINQSSFISQNGKKSLLRQFENQKLMKVFKDDHKKSKKCLAKMKNIFPSDFF